MEKLIGIVNEIQDKFTSLNIECPINLPQIAVVGEQSAGKSSVLENFVGRDFLPRGSGIVTRRPLILQLINKAGQGSNISLFIKDHAVFVHKPNVHYTDFSEVCREIEIETDRVTGKNKNVSPIPINLRVYSPDVLNLTLIDLPGLTKVPIKDQPPDIENQIKNMIQGFISNPNYDGRGHRLPRCSQQQGLPSNPRSQKDIVGKKDINSAKSAEMAFFRSHPKYHGIIDRLGTQYLQKSLSLQLSHHIKETLPEVRQRIMEQLAEVKREIEQNPDLFQDWSKSAATASKILMIKIQDLSRKINTALGYEIEHVDLEKKSKGTIISHILCHTFYDEIEKCKPSPEEMRNGIQIAIMNTQGVRQSLMSASGSFTSATKQFIRFIDQPCLKIVSMVAGVTCEMVDEIVADVFSSYPDLRAEVSDFLRRKVDDSSQTAQNFIKFFLLAQADHINTNHPDFLSAQKYSSIYYNLVLIGPIIKQSTIKV
ncbi:hypothetical protein MXB_4397 [Myxobolus squamalis]|nr:hypothetical protein MXB_4397 [Myxobolus squamalis]